MTFVVVPAWTAMVATSALPAPDAIGTVRLEAAAGVPPVRCFTSAMPCGGGGGGGAGRPEKS